MQMNKTEKILFIAPYEEIKDMALNIASLEEVNIEVVVSYMEDVIPIVNNAKKNDINFVIARGSTASIIKDECDIHVIEMYQNNLEILKAIQKAAKYGSRIALVWYNSIPYKLDLIYDLLQVDVQYYSYHSKRDIEKILESLKNEKIDVIIGGIYTSYYANILGIKSIVVEVDEQSLHWTLNYAKEVINIKRDEEVKRRKNETIIDNVHDGIIFVDNNNVIMAFNPMAEKITSLNVKDVLGKRVDETFHNKELLSMLKYSEQKNQLIDIKTAIISINRTNIEVNNDFVGTVITFQDITKIRQLEQNIRQKLRNKGHIASYTFNDIIGESPLIIEAKSLANKYAMTNETILLLGESGTGKEMFSQSIHNISERRNGPFVAVNCAELSESLFESELFGYEEGAFTGATKGGKEGLFLLAHNGTIFLDEISELPIHLQTVILRVIQEKCIRPVGSDKIIPIDIRIIAASNKDLYNMVLENKFRKDLYYRINVLNIRIPSLKERINDIPLILNNILFKSKASINLTNDAKNIIMDYSWPGNVRELINLVRRILIMYDGQIVNKDCLLRIMPEFLIDLESNNIQNDVDNSKNLDDTINEIIIAAMEKYKGNQTEVAKVLGVSRTFIWKRLKELK